MPINIMACENFSGVNLDQDGKKIINNNPTIIETQPNNVLMIIY